MIADLEPWTKFQNLLEAAGRHSLARIVAGMITQERQQKSGAPLVHDDTSSDVTESIRRAERERNEAWQERDAAKAHAVSLLNSLETVRADYWRTLGVGVEMAKERDETKRLLAAVDKRWAEKHDEQRARAEAAERKESIEEDAKLAAESLLKEALGALSALVKDCTDRTSIMNTKSAKDVLSKARAAGYAVEGEAP